MEGSIADVLAGRATWALVNAENADVLPLIDERSIGCTITDPPYTAHVHANARTNKNDGAGATDLGIDFDAIDSVAFAGELLRVSARWAICFCAMEQLGAYAEAAGERWIRSGVWDRPDGMPQISGDRPAQGAEGIAIMHRAGRKKWNGGGHRALWTCGLERNDRAHPTQKPIALLLDLVSDFTDPNEIVLDPFAGSGTTGVACLRLGRRFIGIERDAKYAAIARERLIAEERGLSLREARAGQSSIFDVLGGTT